MRNVIFAINTTLDGCVDHTKQIADEETHEYFTNLMRYVDLLAFGRKNRSHPLSLLGGLTVVNC